MMNVSCIAPAQEEKVCDHAPDSQEFIWTTEGEATSKVFTGSSKGPAEDRSSDTAQPHCNPKVAHGCSLVCIISKLSDHGFDIPANARADIVKICRQP